MGTLQATALPEVAGVRLDIQFAATVTNVLLGRQDPNGFVTYIRSGDTVPLIGGGAVVWDFEAPMDVPVTYVATQAAPPGSETATSAPVTIVSNGETWLKNPGFPSMNMKLPIVSRLPSLTYPAQAASHPILGRTFPVITSFVRQAPTGTITVVTTTDNERRRLSSLLGGGNVLLLSSPPAFGFGNQYVAFGDVVENRVGLAMDQWRSWDMPFQVTDRPAGLAQAGPGTTWQVVNTTYTSWQALRDTGKSWRQVLEGT